MQNKCSARIISVMLAFLLVLPIFAVGTEYSPESVKTVYAAEDENTATAVLTDEFKTHNFEEVRMGEKNKVNYLVRGGTRSWFMSSANKQDSAYMFFNLSDSFANKVSDGSVFKLEFEYYSQNDGWFQLKYDSQRGEEKNGDIIYMGNTKSWETATVILEDAYFGNRTRDGYDFILSIYALGNNYIYSSGDVPIRNVRVTKYTAKNPITNYCTIDESGNTFSDFQEKKIIYNNLKNTTDREMTVELVNSAITTGGEIKWEGKQSVTLKPYEEKAVPVNVETNWCDLYDYHTEIIGDGFESEFKTQRFAIVKTDPDGIRNERFYINTHPERWQTTTDQMADMLAKMNARGVRFTYGWRQVQWNMGGSPATGDPYKLTFERFKNKGIGILFCLNQFPVDIKAGEEPWHIGNTDTLEQWKGAVEHIVLNSPEDSLFQVWNEPFAPYMGSGQLTNPSPDGFAMFTRETVDFIHSIRPEAKVGIWCLHGMVRDDVYENFYLPGMESEYNMWETADALTQHPYTNMPIENTTMVDVTIKKFKDEFDKRGRADIPIWNTEVGFTPIDKKIGTEENKASFNPRMYMVLTANDLNDIYAHYNFEQKGIVMSNRESNFGIVTCGDPSVEDIYGKVYTATEAYVSAAAMNYLLPQITPDGEFTKDNVMAYRFKSEKFNQDIVSMWGMENDEVRRVDLGTNKLRYFDVNGNETELESDDGIYTFDITHQPFYLIGDIKKVDILEDAPDFTLSQKEFSVLPKDKIAVEVIKNIEGDYTIEAETPEYMGLDEKTEFTDGKATLTFDVLSEFDDNAYILLNIRDKSGKLKEKLEMRCKMTDKAITSDISSSLISTENLNRWRVKITVKNESNTYLKRGYIKFNSPSSFAALEKADIGPIPPQKTAQIVINTPEIVEKGMYNLNYDVVLEDGQSFNFAKAVDFAVSAKVDEKHPIVIDGNIDSDEWDKSTAMYLNSIEQVVGYEDWGGKEDLSGYYIVQWDEENFYLCANVTDDIFYQQGNAIKSLNQGDNASFGVYDDIEMFINSGQGNVDFHGIDMALTENGVKAYRYNAQIFNDIERGEVTDKVDLAVKRDGNKTYYEFKWAWKELLGYEYSPKVGGEIWFDAVFHENDGKGKRGKITFADGLDSSNNVYLFAKLKYIDNK